MATAVKRKLSGSTDGKMIEIAATTSGGADTIHTAVAGTTTGTFDEIWIYACNKHTANVKLTIMFGGTTSLDDYIVQTIPYDSGLILVIPGLILQNSSVVKAFAGTTAVISLGGWVNAITD